MLYHNRAFFRWRCPRSVPIPSILYVRVRLVLEYFGPRLDETTNAPLFNAKAWTSASNLLTDILDGLASDPPGVVLYLPVLDADGNPKVDHRGLPLFWNHRGTTATENAHKTLNATSRGHVAGVRGSVASHRMRRRRNNGSTSEMHRAHYPRLGHFDTQAAEKLQSLVWSNHGIDLYPGLPSITEYSDTLERFDCVPLHSEQLGAAVTAIVGRLQLDDDEQQLVDDGKKTRLQVVQARMSEELTTVAAWIGLPLPFVPVHTRAERSLFSRFMTSSDEPDYDEMALRWCGSVDARDILPKLPNHLRTYYNVWARNKRARDASERAKKGVDALKALNETTKALVAACLGELADAPVAATANQQLRPAPEQARAPSMIPQVVGGVVVGPQAAVLAQAAGSDERKGKGRSEDKKKRGSRHCKLCGRPSKGAAETYHGGTTRPDLLEKNGIDPSCQWLHPDGKSKK